jgi:hypothetical protein
VREFVVVASTTKYDLPKALLVCEEYFVDQMLTFTPNTMVEMWSREQSSFNSLAGWSHGPCGLGAISDTEYFERCGLLGGQKQFQQKDSSSNLPFTNILDMGYRSIPSAWRAGGQLMLQPHFAKSDRKFSSDEVLQSVAVASDRSAFERAVRLMKRRVVFTD